MNTPVDEGDNVEFAPILRESIAEVLNKEPSGLPSDEILRRILPDEYVDDMSSWYDGSNHTPRARLHRHWQWERLAREDCLVALRRELIDASNDTDGILVCVLVDMGGGKEQCYRLKTLTGSRQAVNVG